MPQDDRDRKFEKALGAHLRAACPDAEILASYHERSLSPDEMILWKKHISGCGACQEVLSGLEASEHVVLEDEQKKNLATFGQRTETTRKIRNEPMEETALFPAVPAEPAQRAMPRRMAAWRWAAPAGAIAAGLLVFAVVTELHHQKPVSLPPTQIAENHLPAGEPAAEVKTADSSISPKMKASNQEVTTSKEEAKPEPASPTANGKLPSAEAVPGTENAEGMRKSALDSERNEIANDKLQEKIELKDQEMRKKAAAGFANGPSPQSAQQQMANQQRQAPAAVSAPAAPPPAPQSAEARDEKSRGAGAVAGAASSSQVQEVAPSRPAEFLRASSAAPPSFVSSPGHDALWRVGANGMILYSSDDAAHWESQSSGVAAELTTGSAPSAKVCWVVGKPGTILRTVNGGHEWQRVNSPIAGDIGGIQASDGLHARIWEAGGKASFETSDGGKIWSPVPAE